MRTAYEEINNPNSEIHKQIGKELGPNILDESIDAFVNWYEDIGIRMSEDMEVAGFKVKDRGAERHELGAIVKYSRDHIRIDQVRLKVN
jgi:hypothetical protein